jgi:hypothetical protein
MKLGKMIEALQALVASGVSTDDEVRAWDPDIEEYVPVTGFVYGGESGVVDLQTDEP